MMTLIVIVVAMAAIIKLTLYHSEKQAAKIGEDLLALMVAFFEERSSEETDDEYDDFIDVVAQLKTEHYKIYPEWVVDGAYEGFFEGLSEVAAEEQD